ncbi:MAG: type I-B CRISPR-associated protein Cas7/Csh2 [Candidatus Omnitrophota bacterium]
MNKNQINNSDILFIYDAKMCNPNGDPDDENKPRMDYETETNLVSDVRLKRYIRDYLGDKRNLIFVAEVNGKTVDVTKRLAYWISEKILNDTKEKEDKKKKAIEIKKTLEEGKSPDASKLVELISSQDLLDAFIDVRLFGATMPIKGERGESFTFTGPVQFNWGYSLNKVSLVESSTISSTFAGRTREGQEEGYGTFGKDYRVYYSLIAFHGIISGKRAEHTKLSDEDISLLQEALIKAIPLQATTRSKLEQYPRLILRVEYTDKETFIGDLRRYVKADPLGVEESKVRDVNQIKLNMDRLIKELETHKGKINKIYCWQDKELTPDFCELIIDKDLISKLQPIENKSKSEGSEEK